MSLTPSCPQCGQPLPSDGPQGMCPECLLKTALMNPPQPQPPNEAGTRVRYFGDYELLEEIARGGMGIVWKARQTSLNRNVALKMIRSGALAGPDEVERFLREAEAAANLQHPNIVAIHEVGEHHGQHYFTMDYVAGRDLGSLVKDGPLSSQRAARYVQLIAEAIHFAHQRGTLHRDLKPQNVLIDVHDQPRVTDFGLAKLLHDDSRLTHSGVVMGSPSYMPPEQAAGRHGDVGPASDVYSLGAMLYELLTGRPPFTGATTMATLSEVMQSEPVAPRRLRADVPPDLETICLKCLEKSTASRYPTARTLADELSRFLKGEPIQAKPASTIRKVMSWAKRHPGTLAALASVVMVALAFGIFYLFEENAFLRARQNDPELARIPGPIHQALKVWGNVNSFLVIAGIYSLLFVISRARGLSIKQWFDPAQYAGPTMPLGERTRTFTLFTGLILASYGFLYLGKTIQAHVWEDESISRHLIQIYASIYFGLAMLALVLRDYRLSHHGIPSRTLSPEQVESIRRAMEDFDVLTAVKLYRTAVPDASLGEAREYVLRLADSLKRKHPGKFVPPTLSLATLNGKMMLLGVALEAVLFAALWLLMPPTHPSAFVTQFAYAFLFGMGLMAGTRVRGFWKRFLLLVPALLVWVVGEAAVSEATLSPAACSTGALFGVLLMVFGFTKRRAKG